MGTQGGEQPVTSAETLRQLAEQKEREWKEVQELRTQSVEAALVEKQRELSEEKAKFQKLKEDFKYNLKLLGERDAELDRYDRGFADLKKQLAVRDGEISELKIRLDEAQNAITREAHSKEELQRHYQHRIREKQNEFEQYRSAKDAEVQKEREELETFRRNLERQVREVEEELDVQKMELTAGFEEALRKREHEFRSQADSMSSTVLANDLKVKLLSKELAMLKDAKKNSKREFEQSENSQQQLKKELKQKEWQLQDITAMKEAKIADLEGKLEQNELNMRRMQEDFKRKHAEIERHAREKEAALAKVQDAGRDRERQLQATARDLQARLEDANVKIRQLEWDSQDRVTNRQAVIERLTEELSDVKSRWDSHISEMSRDNVARDVELQTLRENDGKLKAELLQKKEDIARYKQELSAAVEREAALERSKAQVDLDWQRRYEDVERNQYQKAEDLIQNLTSARDEAIANLNEKDRELVHQQDLSRLLTAERDRALATLKQHGLIVDKNLDLSRFQDLPETAADQMAQLQEQNDNLRHVVRQMRQEMEALGEQIPASSSSGGRTARSSATEEYIKNLENDVKSLKIKCRKLQQGQRDASDLEAQAQGQEMAADVAGDNPLVRAHTEQLNNLIGSLRSEKVDLSAQLRKQQAKLQYLQSSVDQLSKEPREKQVQVEQLKYELGAQNRRHVAETASLRQRIADLELQLVETRKEADEYYKAIVERNMEATSAAQELSNLKMEIAQGRPPLNFGAQELMIQQLQDEISRLQKQYQGQGPFVDQLDQQPMKSQGFAAGGGAAVAQLQNKLRLAAKHISQLAREKQQLIEVGNRLRAELNKNGIKAPSPPPRPMPETTRPSQSQPVRTGSSELQQKIQGKLNQLEQLQYELTKQELAHAQKHSHGSQSARVPPIEVNYSSSDNGATGEEEWQPQSILKKPAPSNSVQTMLSPVPEDAVPVRRPVTAPQEPHLKVPPDSYRGRPSTAYADPGSVRPVSPGQPLLMSMSSVGGESLEEIWRMLDDDGLTPRPFTPLSSGEGLRSGHLASVVPDPRPVTGEDLFAVQGSKAKIRIKPLSEQRALSQKAAGRTPSGASPTGKKPKAKIRNYNVQEDDIIK